MPFVTVQLGQCGNQIGTEFFQSLLEDAFKRSGCPDKAEEEYRHEVTQRSVCTTPYSYFYSIQFLTNLNFSRRFGLPMEAKLVAGKVGNIEYNSVLITITHSICWNVNAND